MNEWAHIEIPCDTELLSGTSSEDQKISSWVQRYRDQVYRLAFRITKDPVEAEEVVQDTFLNVFRSQAEFRGQSSVGTWIHRIATNCALMRLRTRRRKPLHFTEDLGSAGRAENETMDAPGSWAKRPQEAVLNAELGKKLSAAVDELPEKYRTILLMRDRDGLSNEEVGEALHLTVSTVKSRLHRSRRHVRERMSPYLNA